MVLKIDDWFKSWMRRRLSDKDYAERVMRALVDCEDCSLIKGHDNVKDVDFLLAIFGNWDEFKDLSQSYVGNLWEMYRPASPEDFENLPQIYEIAFVESDSEEAIIKRRCTLTVTADDGSTTKSEYEDLKLNLINTRLDSEIIRLITGADALNAVREHSQEQ